ncbi:MAG: Ig-like domain-containing protein, partial [Longimicrobiales bacterium]
MTVRHLVPGLLLALPLLYSCGDSTSAPVPSRLVVIPGSATLEALGLSQDFSARLEDKKGNEISGIPITWISENPQVASVSADGTATALSKGTATIEATAEGLTGRATLTVSPTPASMEKLQGDQQTGALSQPLPQILEIEVMDSEGYPVSGQTVTFRVTAGGGTVSPSTTATDSSGRATSTWILGCSDESPQRAVATAGAVTVEFTAEADLSLPAICQSTVPEGRAMLPYSTELEAAGGEGSSLAWSVEGGDLPGGISLSPDGSLAGTPVESGTFSFQARVEDALGHSASRTFGLRICEAPLMLAPGEIATRLPSGSEGCGFFLPAGESGDRYRLGLTWSTSNANDTTGLPQVTVKASRKLAYGVSTRQATPVRLSDRVSPTGADLLAGLPEPFREALRMEAATEDYHHRLRESEREMLRRMGPGARPLRDERGMRTLVSALRAPAPEKLRLIPNPTNECSASGAQVTALKLGENDHVAIYQDSAQAQVDSMKVSTDLAGMMLDYYRDYGAQVIEGYFDGVTDINGDGRVVVFITPVVEADVAAYVWSGDFFSQSQCSTSNEMELVRFNPRTIRGISDGNYQALGTLVHEVKHVSSLYKSISRFRDSGTQGGFQPLWVEEGTAEIAAEMSSRLAWAATGGPPVAAMIRRSDKVITKESYGVLLRLVRVIFHLSSQPNGLVATPVGARPEHSVYGSGWHFHRWLGDVYGNAGSSTMAEAPLFVTLNDSLTAAGPTGIGS